jgi:hypothetical protein
VRHSLVLLLTVRPVIVRFWSVGAPACLEEGLRLCPPRLQRIRVRDEERAG